MHQVRVMMVALALIALMILALACGSDPQPTSTAAPVPQPTAPGPASLAPTQESPVPAATTPASARQEPAAASDPSETYFAMDRVLKVEIEIDPSDWDTLRRQTRTFDDLMAEIEEFSLSRPFANIYDWFSATVTIDGETHTDVGVRKKGFLGSQSDTKPSLKLRYDKYVDGQSLGGVMQRMTLNNSIQDPSMVNTCLSYQVFAAADIPASRCNFATVTVNGRELGLYVHVEEIKKPFLARHFDNNEGNLYEGNVSDFTAVYRGTIEKKTNEDEDDWSDVDAVVKALEDPSDDGLRALSKIVDLDRFLTFWATEVLIGHWDGYAGDRNNFQFYREPDGKFVFMPWGVDDTFHLEDDPNPFDDISTPPPSVLALTAIPNRLYNTQDWQAKYAERMKEVIADVWDEDALLASVETMAAIVQKHALPGERDEAAKDTDRVRKFILIRKGAIFADMTPEPPDWPEPHYVANGGDSVESFELRFDATWGSSQAANPLAEGAIYELGEDGQWVAVARGEAGATAGKATPQEESDIGVRDAALFSLMGLYPDGAIRGVTFWMPLESVAPGATVIIGKDARVGASIWTLPAGSLDPEGFIPVTEGKIELLDADTTAGAAISGRFYAYSFGGAVPQDGSNQSQLNPTSIEASFETSWNSNENPSPFEAGGDLSDLRIGGVPEPAATAAAIAGHASTAESALLPGEAAPASISLLTQEPDGSLSGMTLVMPQGLLVGDSELAIGRDAIAGGVWTIPQAGAAPDNFWPFIEGILTLTAAGTEGSATIAGHFTGLFGSAPGQDSAMVPEGNGSGSELMDIGLVINEVASKGDPSDWFEIHNTLSSPIGLFAMLVSDDLTDAGKRVPFPSGMEIQGGEYLQVQVDSDNWAGFKLGSDEELGIWLLDGTLVAKVDWEDGDSGEGQSFARVPDAVGPFRTVDNPSPGAANLGAN